ncbi:AbrB family transcriptional regulator [Scopulibacillus darangshiensis]|uniref:AbrB family transcriptional regulator n=1 Tax=Scopulibacillus darangshiensis TaxID=442528 RepID=A0A4R2NAG5_9BACL|nr:AbrB/MazE/SpoVT family DNA-binding domain-containing protein [Scopulibacillus darangshiensis]TCP18027.1 AbrB family transcriptional regulator [Scopulibacillus darangshiensis]
MMVKTVERGAHMPQHESIRFKKRSQVTIPKDFVDALQLHEGDRLECRLEDGKIVIVPTVEVPRDQAWFWSEQWQKEENEVEQELRDGRVSAPMNLDETLSALDDLSKEK